MMRRKSVGMLLCVVMLFGIVAVPSAASAGERSEDAGSFSSAELAAYGQMQAEADEAGLLEKEGGEGASTGVIILATIGVLVLVGAVIAASA